MPATTHLIPRFLEAGSSTVGISPAAIGLVVGVGIIPVFILFYVVAWLFWCYPYNRSCCCTRRKKKESDEENGYPVNNQVMREKAVYDVPSRPHNAYRTESGSSSNGSRLTKSDPRLSTQSMGSNNMQYAQEPKRFV